MKKLSVIIFLSAIFFFAFTKISVKAQQYGYISCQMSGGNCSHTNIACQNGGILPCPDYMSADECCAYNNCELRVNCYPPGGPATPTPVTNCAASGGICYNYQTDYCLNPLGGLVTPDCVAPTGRCCLGALTNTTPTPVATCSCDVAGSVNGVPFCRWSAGCGATEGHDCPCPSGTTPTSGPPIATEGCSENEINTAIGCISFASMTELTAFFLSWGIGIAGGIAFILIVYAGFLIITSSGDPKRLSAGRELLTSAFSGLILLIFSVFVLRIIGYDILQIPGF